MEIDPNIECNRTIARSSRRIKTQTLLPSAETAAMLFWALLASGVMAKQCASDAE
jgi:hypothetical protein